MIKDIVKADRQKLFPLTGENWNIKIGSRSMQCRCQEAPLSRHSLRVVFIFHSQDVHVIGNVLIFLPIPKSMTWVVYTAAPENSCSLKKVPEQNCCLSMFSKDLQHFVSFFFKLLNPFCSCHSGIRAHVSRSICSFGSNDHWSRTPTQK